YSFSGNSSELEANNSNYTSEDLAPPEYMYAYVTVCNVVIFLVGVIGNVMVLLVMVRMRVMRTRVNYFFASLSAADLLVLIVCQPSAMLEFYTREQWLLGHFMCKLIPFLEHWSLHASVLTLLLIGFDRYFLICRPQSRPSPTYTWLPLLPVWILSCFSAIPFIFLTRFDIENRVDGTHAEACVTEANKLHSRIFVAVIFGLTFVLPLVLLIFIYTSVIRALRRLGGGESLCMKGIANKENPEYGIHPSTARSRRQVTRMMVAIVVLFFVCLMPFKILTMWLTFDPGQNLTDLGYEPYYNLLSISRLVTYINSAGNPVIYAWMSPRFRRAFSLSLPRCKERSEMKAYYMN
ncbi:unnamed protein product, partial [Lymnaea stagnalis]